MRISPPEAAIDGWSSAALVGPTGKIAKSLMASSSFSPVASMMRAYSSSILSCVRYSTLAYRYTNLLGDGPPRLALVAVSSIQVFARCAQLRGVPSAKSRESWRKPNTLSSGSAENRIGISDIDRGAPKSSIVTWQNLASTDVSSGREAHHCSVARAEAVSALLQSSHSSCVKVVAVLTVGSYASQRLAARCGMTCLVP